MGVPGQDDIDTRNLISQIFDEVLFATIAIGLIETIVGSDDDAQKFKKGLDGKVEVLILTKS